MFVAFAVQTKQKKTLQQPANYELRIDDFIAILMNAIEKMNFMAFARIHFSKLNTKIFIVIRTVVTFRFHQKPLWIAFSPNAPKSVNFGQNSRGLEHKV